MPYTRVGAMKISDHHVRSPVLNLNNACQTCHHWPEEELKSRIELIQGRTLEMRNIAMDALIDLIGQIEKAKAAGATDVQLEQALGFQRKAQFLVDFIESKTRAGSMLRRRRPGYWSSRSTTRAAASRPWPLILRPIRILNADDHALFRDGLRSLLTAQDHEAVERYRRFP